MLIQGRQDKVLLAQKRVLYPLLRLKVNKLNSNQMDKAELCRKLKNEGFSNPIIKAFQNVERKNFIPMEYHALAYDDIPLPIGSGQTISQPSTIAFMLSLLELEAQEAQNRSGEKTKILEVGSGSGYVLALIEQIAPNAKIFGAERIKEIYESSIINLKNTKKINIFHTPKGLGLPDFAPFDRIIVSASANRMPDRLIVQLNDSGIMVCPIKNSIFKIIKKNNKIIRQEFPGFRFVPLL